jgi:hypothetical protein
MHTQLHAHIHRPIPFLVLPLPILGQLICSNVSITHARAHTNICLYIHSSRAITLGILPLLILGQLLATPLPAFSDNRNDVVDGPLGSGPRYEVAVTQIKKKEDGSAPKRPGTNLSLITEHCSLSLITQHILSIITKHILSLSLSLITEPKTKIRSFSSAYICIRNFSKCSH